MAEQVTKFLKSLNYLTGKMGNNTNPIGLLTESMGQTHVKLVHKHSRNTSWDYQQLVLKALEPCRQHLTQMNESRNASREVTPEWSSQG